MSVRICEFSRKLLDPKIQEGKWVSTGFEKEIGLRFGPKSGVPEIIETTVNNHLFRLNDNYPPTEGKLSLIAKEFEKYSILLVANNLSDDKARPLVGYRYFWLEKPKNTQIDGVGTLLKWWESKGEPCLELKSHQETESLQKENYKNGYYNAEVYQPEDFQKYYHPVEDIYNQIKKTPYLVIIKEEQKKSQHPSYLQLHSLALHLQKERKRPIAWTWNIFKLDNPHKFILICCADEESFEWNRKNIKHFIAIDERIDDSLSSDPVQKTSTHLLKQAIQKIAENKGIDKYSATLNKELSYSDSVQWDWGKLIDETWLETHKKFQIDRYKSLVLLLNPNLKIGNFKISPIIWIESLKDEGDYINALAVQNQLTPILLQLEDKIDEIINQLLLNLLISNTDSNHKRIEQLFFQSESLWSNPECLILYSQRLFSKLEKRCKYKQDLSIKESNKFVERINEDFELWKKLEKQKKQAGRNKNLLLNSMHTTQSFSSIPSFNNLSNYQKLAKFFEKIKNESTSAIATFFYQLSTGKVPRSIPEKYPKLPLIIPLKSFRRPEEKSNDYLSKFAINFLKYDSFSEASHLTKYTISNSFQTSDILLLWPVQPKNTSILKRWYPMFAILVSHPSVNDYFKGSFNQMWKIMISLSIGSITLGTLLGVGLGIPIQNNFKLYDKVLYSSISQNKSDVISSNPIRELYLYLNLLETGNFNKDSQQKNIKNLEKLIELIPNFNDNKFKESATRTAFFENRNKTLLKEELEQLYGYVKGLTPPVKEKLSQTYKTDEIDNKNPVKNIEIKQVKEILKQPLAIYDGEITDRWDKETLKAINGFQKQYNIEPSETDFGPETWKVLSIIIQDKQVEQAARKLKSIIEESKTYDQFKTKYNKLNECKTITDKLYSECLREDN